MGPAIVLSKIYANSMMVFLNDRIPYGHDGSGQAISLEMMTGSLHPHHLATLPGPADAAQGQLALEGCNSARDNTPGQTAVPPKKHRYLA